MSGISTLVKSFFSQGHQRSILAKKNIAWSLLIKGMNITVSFVAVPMTINYITPSYYGVWLTLGSIIAWFGFFDIGFGNGLKNKLTEAIAQRNDSSARSYVSTTYFMLLLVSLVLLIVFLVGNRFIHWAKVLNAPMINDNELRSVAIIMFSIFSTQFVLQLLNVVCYAKQNTALTAAIGLIGNLLGLFILFFLARTTNGSLLYLSLSIGASPVIVLLLFNIVLFKTSYRKYAPSYKLINIKYIKDILPLGLKFFIIQIGLLFFYSTDNVIISHVVGPDAVTSFNVAFKYFSSITMLSGIIMTPLWSAFTEAHVKKDFDWIRNTVRRLEGVVVLVFVLGAVMLLVSTKVYEAWVGVSIHVPLSLSVVMMFYVVINTYRTIFCYYLNGIGKITMQLNMILASALVNIPLSIYLGSIFGTTGVILSTTILCFVNGIVERVQYRKLINNRAVGLWNK